MLTPEKLIEAFSYNPKFSLQISHPTGGPRPSPSLAATQCDLMIGK